MRGIPHVSRLALYYAGNALLPAKPLASPSAILHVVPSSVPLSGKKARRALGLVPSRIVDASLLHERLFVDEDDDGILSHLPSAPFYAALSSFSRSRLFPLCRSCERGVLLQSSGYAARFISYPTNWEARTAARIPERRFPPLRGMRYRERETTRPDGISDERTGIAAAEAPSAFLGVAGVFQLRRDALSAMCSGSVN